MLSPRTTKRSFQRLSLILGFVVAGCSSADTPDPDDASGTDSGADTGAAGCAAGYSMIGPSCVDNDECAAITNPCGANTVCTNTAGSYACSCAPGFGNSGSSCVDLNECAAVTNPCSVNSICTNTPGTYTCACTTGYSNAANPSGPCIDVNECSGTNPCTSNLTCTNTPGSYTCACAPGTVMGTSACVPDVNECTAGTDDCDPNATCTNTADAFSCACDTGYYGNGTTCTVGACDVAIDADTGTATFSITHLAVPAGSVGFNLDRIDNAQASPGVGSDVPGCGRVDGAGGIDNELATVAASVIATTDLSDVFQQALVGVPDSMDITVRLTHLAAGSPADDPCVGVELFIESDYRADQTILGSGTLVNHVFVGALQSEYVLPAANVYPDAYCTNMMCSPGVLDTTIRGGRVRLELNSSHTTLQDGLFGGFIFFNDANAGYATANTTGHQTSLTNWANQVGLATTFKDMLVQGFASARDLHMEPDGELSPCTGANTSAVNKNSVSVALRIDSL
jgi:hypothetical protein